MSAASDFVAERDADIVFGVSCTNHRGKETVMWTVLLEL